MTCWSDIQKKENELKAMNTEACEKQLKGTPMAPIMSISRLRLRLDGDGVTTLVTFYGCRLRCKYCINPECFNVPDESRYYTPRQLLDELMQDDVYCSRNVR